MGYSGLSLQSPRTCLTFKLLTFQITPSMAQSHMGYSGLSLQSPRTCLTYKLLTFWITPMAQSHTRFPTSLCSVVAVSQRTCFLDSSVSHLEELYLDGISMETSFNSLVRLKRLAIQEKKPLVSFRIRVFSKTR